MTSLLAGIGIARPGPGARFALLGATVAWFVFGTWSAALAARLNPPGEVVDIGGRRLHIVCDGPKDGARPTVLFESGAFGFSADWAAVQAKLTAKGVHSCAYDRAGMGFSDPGPKPRDGLNVVQDLENLLKAVNEPGPYVLVGHSMAGLRVRLFASRNPDQVVGLVLVDATTPEAMDDPTTQQDVASFTTGSQAAAAAASVGLKRLLSTSSLADKIGLTGEALAEERQVFASARRNRVAAEEVEQWPLTARQARESGPLNPAWPVAVVSAGLVKGGLRDVQAPPAEASRHGYIDIVAGASHHTLLGPRFSDAIVRGIVFVMDAAGKPAAPLTVATEAFTAGGDRRAVTAGR
jgi:pimeloyl-ACP methyl ester carboxylesterase